MIDLLKKTMLTGVGLGLMTLDKVEEVAREIANSAEMSADKGQEFVNEAVARARKGREDLEATVRRIVGETLKEGGAATRDELAELAARVEKLEQGSGSGAE